MNPFSFDFESALIRPGVCAPEAACMTWQMSNMPAGILHVNEVEPFLRRQLEDKSILFIGANTAFDFGVVCANWPHLMDLVWDAYSSNRVSDVQIRDKLLDIAAGRYQGYHTKEGGWLKPRYSLADCAKRAGMYLDKPQSIVGPDGKKIDDPEHARLRFQELIHLPLEQWDKHAAAHGWHGPPPTHYAKEDAVATLLVYQRQEVHAAFLELEYEFTRRAWALHLISTWGIRTNKERVVKLVQDATAERMRLAEWLQEEGLVRADGTRDTKTAHALMEKVCEERGIPVPRTPGGAPQLGEDACDATEDPLLIAYADFGRLGSTISKDGTLLAKGTLYPIHTRFDMAATGRTTSSKPNMQNFGRDVGPRECFVSRPGTVIAQADYEALELRTLAQCCVSLFGHSKLADALNTGRDPHLQMGADILGVTYEQAKAWRKFPKGSPEYKRVDDARQLGKVANFGFPGGLGAEKLVLWGRKTYNVIITVERARMLKQEWLRSWPEMNAYFCYVNALIERGNGLAEVEVPISGFLRGGAQYCAACNTSFQSLGASAAGRGVWHVQKACYRDRSSVLFGSRTVNFVHDEMLVEVPDDSLAHERALELEKLMCKGANELLPDVPATAPPMLMRYWSKNAYAMYDNGRLIPWAG